MRLTKTHFMAGGAVAFADAYSIGCSGIGCGAGRESQEDDVGDKTAMAGAMIRTALV